MVLPDRIARWLLSILLLTVLATGFAQITFFIKPMFHTKTGCNFVESGMTNSKPFQILQNQYFYTPYATTYSPRVITNQSLDIGLGGGIILADGDKLIQLTYNRDAAHFQVASQFRGYFESHYNGFGGTFGVIVHRAVLSYSQRIPEKIKFIESWFNIGVGSFLNFNQFTGTFPADWNLPVSPNGDQLLRTYFQPLQEKRMNGVLKLGFENDFYMKNKYLVSLNLMYLQGLGLLARMDYVHEYVINNEFVYHNVGLLSRGSGFYVELSRRINLYPRQRNKNRPDE